MKLSLNWIKKYVDIPENLSIKKIASDLTLRTVEVEEVIDLKEKYKNIVVGKILEVKDHPNSDKLKLCITDIGESNPVQIVCGGSNLYKGEYVIVSKPGAVVYWHGEGEPVVIEETTLRGETSYGMICAASEVSLDKLFPISDEREIVDLKGIECQVGAEISKVLGLDDYIIDIDNKSLSNRPDLWGHYGIAREIAAIYKLPLKSLDTYTLDKDLKSYDVEIQDTSKCQRFVAIEIENVNPKPSPLWMQTELIKGGMRPINAIVDITNYVMMAIGQPSHTYDRTHIEGNKIIARNAQKGEELVLLDDNKITLEETDLVIADTKEVLGLAGIRGGKKDSILETTTGILLEVANFTAPTIRKTSKKFIEKTEAAMRYEKNIDTERVTDGVNMLLNLFKEIFPECKIVAYNDVYPVKTERAKIDVYQEFLDNRLGVKLSQDTITETLTYLGYDVNYDNGIYHTTAPIWRSTGDVSLRDDVLGDIARILSFDSFEAKPLPVNFTSAVNQPKITLERRVREYLAYRCGFNEIFTYPWVDEKYIKASRIVINKPIRLATPPSPEQATLRNSLVPGIIEAISKNTRYFEEFRIFEMAQVFESGVYRESIDEEVLPIHKKYLTGAIVGKDERSIFLEAKGVVECMGEYCHMENLAFIKKEKPSWADINAYLNITLDNEIIGSISLLSYGAMNDAKIKRTNACIFEVNFDKFRPFPSRTNTFTHIPEIPLVLKDLSVICDESISWSEIATAIKDKVYELEFIGEYRGDQIPEGKKSLTFRFKISSDKTLTNEEITNKMNDIIDTLKGINVLLREE